MDAEFRTWREYRILSKKNWKIFFKYDDRNVFWETSKEK